MKPRLSLKGRALQLLAQREQSRAELRRKLMKHAKAAVDGVTADDPDHAAGKVDEVLTWLEANQFSSDQRFAESRVHARSARFGNLRIRGELAQHGVQINAEQVQRLKDSEFERAWQVWQRKFGDVLRDAGADAGTDVAASLRQSRFLAGRGFTAEAIRQVLRAAARQRAAVD